MQDLWARKNNTWHGDQNPDICQKNHGYIKNKYGNNSSILFTIVWCLKLRPKMFMKILVRIKKCLILVIIQVSQNIMII